VLGASAKCRPCQVPSARVPCAKCQDAVCQGVKCQVPSAKCQVPYLCDRTEDQLQITLVPVPVAVFGDCAMTGPTNQTWLPRAFLTVPAVPTGYNGHNHLCSLCVSTVF
jgi:hypothetical protein